MSMWQDEPDPKALPVIEELPVELLVISPVSNPQP